MNIPRIITKVYYEPWAILPDTHAAIRSAVEAKLRGESPVIKVKMPDDKETGIERAGDVALIPVHGIIGKHLSELEMLCGGCSLDAVQDQIEEVGGDDGIQHVVFDFRTPGGTVTGVPEIGELIAELTANKDNTLAFTDSLCCSAGYWMASQCAVIAVTKSSILGSIGVRAYYEDASRYYKNQGVEPQEFSSGKFKTMGSPYRPMTDEEKAMIQKRVDDYGAEFRDAVRSTREIQDDKMEGQIFSGKEAAAIGMADYIVKGIDDAIEKLLA